MSFWGFLFRSNISATDEAKKFIFVDVQEKGLLHIIMLIVSS